MTETEMARGVPPFFLHRNRNRQNRDFPDSEFTNAARRNDVDVADDVADDDADACDAMQTMRTYAKLCVDPSSARARLQIYKGRQQGTRQFSCFLEGVSSRDEKSRKKSFGNLFLDNFFAVSLNRYRTENVAAKIGKSFDIARLRYLMFVLVLLVLVQSQFVWY